MNCLLIAMLLVTWYVAREPLSSEAEQEIVEFEKSFAQIAHSLEIQMAMYQRELIGSTVH